MTDGSRGDDGALGDDLAPREAGERGALRNQSVIGIIRRTMAAYRSADRLCEHGDEVERGTFRGRGDGQGM